MEQLKFATKKFDVLKNNIYNTIKSTGGSTSHSNLPPKTPQNSNSSSNNISTSNNMSANSNSIPHHNSSNSNGNKKNKNKTTTPPQLQSQPQVYTGKQNQQQMIYESLYSDDEYTVNKLNYNQVSNEYIYSNNSHNHINNNSYDNFEDLDDISFKLNNTNINNNSNNNSDSFENYENYQFVVKQKKSSVNNNSQNVNNNNLNKSPKKKEKNPYSFNEFTKTNNNTNVNNKYNNNNEFRDSPKLVNYNEIYNNLKTVGGTGEEFYEENLEENGGNDEDDDEIDEEFEDFVQIKENNINPICVQYYIPFYQSPEMCRNETAKWLEERWFLPANMNGGDMVKWTKQNRFFFPVYVFIVSTTTLFNATFTINDVSNTVSNQKITSNYDEIIFCASNSIDSDLVDQLIKENSYSNRSTHKLPNNEELIGYTPGKNLGEKTLTIDIGKDDVWKNQVHPFIVKEERKKCIKAIKEQYYVKSLDLQMRDPIIESERYFIVYLPISSETYQYSDSFYDTLTSGNKGKTVGQRPIGTGVIGGTIIDVVSKVSNLVNDSIGM